MDFLLIGWRIGFCLWLPHNWLDRVCCLHNHSSGEVANRLYSIKTSTLTLTKRYDEDPGLAQPDCCRRGDDDPSGK